MLPFKYKIIIGAVLIIPFIIAALIGGVESANKYVDYLQIAARSLINATIVGVCSFTVFRLVQLRLKLEKGGCIEEELRVVIHSTTFIFIHIAFITIRYGLS